MLNLKTKDACSGCFSCTAVCPKGCITMESDAEGFLYPSVDSQKCIECGMCEKACPVLNKPKTSFGSAVSARILEENIREKSSSGGVFTVIAQHVLNNGGVVFGAAFNKDFEVEHVAIETIEELEELRGSKYLQSRIGDTYIQAKKHLESGRLVLYTGTPCQIAGLQAFLRREYDNLICQDIICHGVPSPLVWKKYLELQKKKANSEIKSIYFRDKILGWRNFSLTFNFVNGERISRPLTNDSYMRAFLRNLSLRPSCYNCAFKGTERHGDLTLADFWGIQNVLPQMDDDKGTSLVLINTEKGRALLEAVSERVVCENVDLNAAIRYNSAATRSVEMPKRRGGFMKEILCKSFDKTVQKYCKRDPFLVRALRRVKNRIFKK